MDFKNFGTLDFREFLEMQDRLVGERKLDNIPDTVILAEHPTTISLGARANEEQLIHLRCSEEWLKDSKIPIVKTRRGGSISVHGEGILGCYVILKVKNFDEALLVMRKMESLATRALGRSRLLISILPDSLKRDRMEKAKYRGLWIVKRPDSEPIYVKKIVSLGFGFGNKVTRFGMSINVCPENWILKLVNPCGIAEYELTSVKIENGIADMALVRRNIIDLAPQYF